MSELAAEVPAENPTDLRGMLLAIREKRGRLTPQIVLDEARDPAHPLHSRFEWDNNIAAEKYRLLQAASLLRVKYKTETSGGQRDLRAFWVTRPVANDDENAESEYTPIEEVILDPIAKQLMLNQMRREWKAFQSRYGNMMEFADFVLEQLTADAAGA